MTENTAPADPAGMQTDDVSSMASETAAPVSPGESRWTDGLGDGLRDYAAGKGAIDIMTKGLAREVGEEGIRVNAVAPGYTLTEMSIAGQIATRFEEFRHEVPLGRIGTTEEVAAGIYWLCTDESSYVTGSMMPVAGGRV